ncbi:MAG TPA: preprotein translocase subunit SecA [Candidatus Saccharimonadales bacterium]|nr:preprotein translocase subunit SecA [Candidatus Saccharimonadales bacterium]
MAFFPKLFGDPNKREVGRYQTLVDEVNNFEPELEKLTDADLTKKSQELKTEISAAATKLMAETADFDDIDAQHDTRRKQLKELLEPKVAYAFALTREAAKRTIGLRHYDVQLIGGAVLHQGQIAEMQTGEGKTLVASLPLYLNALTGLGTHLVTVNDYLARRDAGWMAPIYHFLGLSIGVIGPQFSYLYDPTFESEEADPRLKHLRPVSRPEAYQADITYGTNNEYGFDYLRDNMAGEVNQLNQRELVYAIVDEVDSILIDEARTPLIISAMTSESAVLYQQFAKYMPKLVEKTDYEIDEKARSAALTESGIHKLEKFLGINNMYDPGNVALVHHADTALKAYALYKKNKEYVVKDGEVIIIDEFTGRMLAGRRYSSGLHQAIEAKEGVNVQEESTTMATITFQNYFRLYYKLSGMTGTATTEAEEFSKIYNLEVVSIPTHRPSARKDESDAIYKTEEAKFKAVVDLVKNKQQAGQPVLIGTVSITKSEKLGRLLKAAGVTHSVLNAKQHQKEGQVVEKAGEPGAVTVATNMAGRGVDIVLGGAAPSADQSKSLFDSWEKNHQKVLELGGLLVIGTERHESRRIDNQLRGRSGRQGDPGQTQFFVSMEDDLMRIFGGDRMKSLMERLNVPDDMSINNSLLSRAIEQAQSRVEGHNFDIRKQLVEYDDVTNKQREAIYRRRARVLHTNNPEQAEALHADLLSRMTEEEKTAYETKSKVWTPEVLAQVEKIVTLRAIDVLWVEHLKNLEDLRESIGLRGYGQREPIVEYKQEAYGLFNRLQDAIDSQIIAMLLHAETGPIQQNQPPVAQPPAERLITNNPEEAAPIQAKNDGKIGRNDPCPCGAIDPKTGKVYKFKKCGLVNAPWHKG